MARYFARSRTQARVFLTSLGTLLACSAPVEENDDESVPEFRGTLPSAGGFGAVSAQNPAGPGSSNGSPGNEGIGSNAGSIPVSSPGSNGMVAPGSMGSGTGGAGGSVMTSNPTPSTGTGGSAMPVSEPGNGAGGSALPAGGTGNVPPGNTPPGTPPPVTPPVIGSGCGPSAIFCEDFDDFNLGVLNGTVNGLRVDRIADIVDEPGRGRVLRAQGGTGYGNKSGVFLDNFAPPNNSFFGRAFVSVDQFPSAGGDHWVIVEATANGAGEQVRPVGGQFSRWAPGSDGPSAGDWTDWEQSDAATRGGTWECVEWQVNGANGANDLTLWVNGEQIDPLDRANFRLPAINRLWFGWVVFQNGQPPTHEVRFDDIVLSTERVGCD